MAQRCDWQGRVCDLSEHLRDCGLEEVECPCPGCEERMARAEVAEHVAASGAVHLQRALSVVAELEGKVAGLHEKITAKEGTIEDFAKQLVLREGQILAQSLQPGERVPAQALTHVFTWSTDSNWSPAQSTSHIFADGLPRELRGHCLNNALLMGFCLEGGPACDMHFK